MARVLIAFDGSETSAKAITYTVKFIKPSKLFILYVINEDDIRWPSRIDIPIIWGGNIYELERNILELHKKHAQEVLKKAKKLLKGRKAKLFYQVGDPADTIIKKAQDLSCDLIVVGSRSRSNIQFILGSVAQRVAAKSSISVLIVKPEIKPVKSSKKASS